MARASAASNGNANEMELIRDAQGRQCWFKLTGTGAMDGYKERSDDKSDVLSVLRDFGTTKHENAN
ncbi:MAG: hypothetical protein SGI72_02300 [Planctomycetota bacterium]|nr:hypothetical protein [Planctomycetota bacterium]